MIALIQRVSSSFVKIDNKQIASIKKGYNILLGIQKDDTKEDIYKLTKKILNLRLFPNEDGKMDKNIQQINGQILVISQFTLPAKIKKGNRPDFTDAMKPAKAKILYEEFIKELQKHIDTKSGEFGAMMEVSITNDGPVTIIANSKLL